MNSSQNKDMWPGIDNWYYDYYRRPGSMDSFNKVEKIVVEVSPLLVRRTIYTLHEISGGSK